MSTLDILVQAIKEKKPIEFEYNKEGKIEGKRIGQAEIPLLLIPNQRTRPKIHTF